MSETKGVDTTCSYCNGRGCKACSAKFLPAKPTDAVRDATAEIKWVDERHHCKPTDAVREIHQIACKFSQERFIALRDIALRLAEDCKEQSAQTIRFAKENARLKADNETQIHRSHRMFEDQEQLIKRLKAEVERLRDCLHDEAMSARYD